MTTTTTTTAARVTLAVHGIPQPKGSLKAFQAYRSRRLVVTSDNPKLRAWQQAVHVAAVQQFAPPFPGPVAVWCDFILPRPTSLPKRVVYAVKKPDVDKLARAVLDAIAGVLFGDDAAVVELHAAKHYCTDGILAGVVVTVADATDRTP